MQYAYEYIFISVTCSVEWNYLCAYLQHGSSTVENPLVHMFLGKIPSVSPSFTWLLLRPCVGLRIGRLFLMMGGMSIGVAVFAPLSFMKSCNFDII